MNKYNYIHNPETGRNVKIYSKKGKQILKKYVQFSGFKKIDKSMTIQSMKKYVRNILYGGAINECYNLKLDDIKLHDIVDINNNFYNIIDSQHLNSVFIRSNKLCGKGSIKEIYMGIQVKNLTNIKLVAWGDINLRIVKDPNIHKNIIKEVKLLKQLKETNKIYFDYFIDTLYDKIAHKVSIITNFFPMGTITEYLMRNFKGGRYYRKLIELLIQLSDGVSELHKLNIVHRDIKPANILIGENGGIKIIDFGESIKLESRDEIITTLDGGTPLYMAPEMLMSPIQYVENVDVYAIGITIMNLCLYSLRLYSSDYDFKPAPFGFLNYNFPKYVYSDENNWGNLAVHISKFVPGDMDISKRISKANKLIGKLDNVIEDKSIYNILMDAAKMCFRNPGIIRYTGKLDSKEPDIDEKREDIQTFRPSAEELRDYFQSFS